MNILILGGTGEARDLAVRLLALGHDVTTSLAGVTSSPILPEGKLRVGGFGGVDGLLDYLTSSRVELLVDATHPFAAQMSHHAHEAAERRGLPLLRLERPAWTQQQGDNWLKVASIEEAAKVLPAHSRVFVTTGRKHLETLFAREDISGVIRVVEPLQCTVPAPWRQLLDRPPYSFAQEQALFEAEQITHLVTKNAGGESTSAKLEAARFFRVPVVMIARPGKPPCLTFAAVDELVAWLGTGRIGG